MWLQTVQVHRVHSKHVCCWWIGPQRLPLLLRPIWDVFKNSRCSPLVLLARCSALRLLLIWGIHLHYSAALRLHSGGERERGRGSQGGGVGEKWRIPRWRRATMVSDVLFYCPQMCLLRFIIQCARSFFLKKKHDKDLNCNMCAVQLPPVISVLLSFSKLWLFAHNVFTS